MSDVVPGMAEKVAELYEMNQRLAAERDRYKAALEETRCATQAFHDADPECEYKHSEDWCDCDRRCANKALFPPEIVCKHGDYQAAGPASQPCAKCGGNFRV